MAIIYSDRRGARNASRFGESSAPQPIPKCHQSRWWRFGWAWRLWYWLRGVK